MRLLVLGGTWFLGRAIVELALADGHDVTTFNRGRTADDVPAARIVRGDRTHPGDLGHLRASGAWDTVIDTSGYVPADVLAAAHALEDRADRYLFVSTTAAYAAWPAEPVTEDAALRDCPPTAVDADDGDRGERYGRLKAGCERAVRDAFAGRTVVLRPGVLLGPREYLGRLPWWLRRLDRGGEILAPGPADRPIQPVDVRDAAAFALRAATADDVAAAYNVAAPDDHATFGGLLAACAAATGADPKLTWVPGDFLTRHGVAAWTELPLWRPHRGTWRVDASRARAAGLTCRPIGDTVRDTWHWLRDAEPPAPEEPGRGLDPDTEWRLLQAWHG